MAAQLSPVWRGYRTVEPRAVPQVTPQLRTAHPAPLTSRDFTSWCYHLRPYQRVIVETARGRLDEVRAICRDDLSKWPSDSDLIQLPKQICGRLAGNETAGIASLLHEWEATTVRNLKIEHLWEPTPFPLETGCGT